MSVRAMSYGERLARAVDNWKKARQRSDDAWRDMEGRRLIYERLLTEAGEAFQTLDHLIRDEDSNGA